jgi:hypothetical protein
MIVTADSSCSRSSTTLPVSMYADLNLRKPCRYALIDKSGTILSDARFDEALDFSEGLAAVQVGKLWGFVDRAGRMVIAPRFRSSGRFSGGIAAVAVEGEPDSKPLWGYIDTSGVFVIPPQFQRAQAFSDGLAVVGDGDFVWYIDRSGRSPIAGKFRAAGRFFKGLAHVEQSHVRYAYIDRTGKAVFTYTDRRD